MNICSLISMVQSAKLAKEPSKFISQFIHKKCDTGGTVNGWRRNKSDKVKKRGLLEGKFGENNKMTRN
jgi:hypothetical protein